MIDGHNLNSDEAAAREVIAVVGDEGFFDENINLEKLGKYYGQMYVRFDMEKYLGYLERFNLDRKAEIQKTVQRYENQSAACICTVVWLSLIHIFTNMGSGASGMFETCMVAVLVAAMCALIREYGGFDALLSGIYRMFRGKRGGLLGMGLLVGLIDIATAKDVYKRQ